MTFMKRRNYKKYLRMSLLVLLPVALMAQPQLVHEWSDALNTYPAYTRGSTTRNLSAKDASNNFYLAGNFTNTADFDPSSAEFNITAAGNGHIYLSKYTPAGAMVFAKRIGDGAGIISLTGLTIDGDNNIYTVGTITGRGDFNTGEAPGDTLWLDGFGSSAFVAKYNSNGVLQYAFLLETRISQSSIFLFGIKVGTNNLLYLAGTYAGEIDINPSAASTIITTVDANPQGVLITYNKNTGTLNNFVTFSHTGTLMGVADLALDAQDNCFIAGSFSGNISFSGTGGAVVLSSSGNTDIFMAGWNAGGTLLQAKSAGGTGADRGRSILIGADGSLYLSAAFSGTADVNLDPGVTTNLTSAGADGFLSKYSPNGTLVYVFELSPANKMLLVANDTLIVSGLFKGTRDFNPSAVAAANLSSALTANSDVYAASYTPAGIYNWAFRITSTGPKSVYGLIPISTNQFVVSGDYQSDLNTNPAGTTTYSSLSNKSNGFFSIYQNSNAAHVFSGITGVNRTETDMAKSVALGTNGDVYVTGYFSKTIDADPTAAVQSLASEGGSDIFIAKYNRSGLLIFAFRLGSTMFDQGKCIAVDNSGNFYVAGLFSGTVNFDPSITPNPAASLSAVAFQDIFISKYNSTGQWIFTKQIGGTSTDIVNKLVIDRNGNLLVAGSFAGTADFDPDPAVTKSRTSLGSYDAFIAKYTPSGALVFAHQIGGTGYDEGFGTCTNTSGEIYLCGTFSATVDFNPSATGTHNLTVTGSRDAYFAKFDAAGNFLFAHGMGSTSADQANEIITDRAGNTVVAGYFFNTIDLNPDPVISNNFTSAGSNDLFIAWYTNAGVYIRAIKTGGTALDEPRAIRYDEGNNIIVAGRFSGTSDFNPDDAVTNNLTGGTTDAFVAAYTSTGQYIFAKAFGAFDQDDALGLAVDTITKAIYIAGQFDESVNFSTAGRPDAFLQTDIDANAFIARYSTVPLVASFVWTGNINTAWETSGNWGGNTVPASTSAVIIPAGRTRYPIVNAATTVKSISCAAGASVTILTGVVFNVLK